jgi:hypothetical protein
LEGGRWLSTPGKRAIGFRVVSGMFQVVSGKNFKLRIDAVNGDGKEGMYIAEVYDQPWIQTRTLDYFVPTN